MVSHLLSGVAQGFNENFNTFLVSPQPSPILSRKVVGRQLAASPILDKKVFMEFSSQNEPLGRIVIKVSARAGRVGWVFESLTTHRDNFGYRGSRVYACCKNEWLLLGDLLYNSPKPDTPPHTDWNPRQQLSDGVSEDQTDSKEDWPSYPKLHHGYRGMVETECDMDQDDVRGAVVAVASDFDLESQTWSLGPQIKICLSDSSLRSGRVIGQVTEGLEVAQKISLLAGFEREPASRVTITDCGFC